MLQYPHFYDGTQEIRVNDSVIRSKMTLHAFFRRSGTSDSMAMMYIAKPKP